MTTRTKARSITHEHLLGVVLSELASRRPDGGSRLLDVGCGDGALLAYFGHRLPELAPHAPVELYGFDVRDHGVQEAGFMAATRWDSLAAAHPRCDWDARDFEHRRRRSLALRADSFDVVVSNQVLEHVPRSRPALRGDAAVS